jgi:hypothetical protein
MGVALDERGLPVDAAGLYRTESTLARKRRGALSSRLETKVAAAAVAGEWLRVRLSYFPTLKYPPKDLIVQDPGARSEWEDEVARGEVKAEAVLKAMPIG